MTLKAVVAAVVLSLAGVARAEVALHVTYLRQEVEHPPVLSNLDAVPADLGLAGARLGLADNMTTGGFLGHTYTLDEISVPVGGDLAAAARDALATSAFVILDAPAPDALRVADLPEAETAMLFSVSAPDDALRGADCRANLFHTLPSLAMRADALMQFLVKRRWTDVALVQGAHPEDQAWGAALTAAAAKFQVRLRTTKTWSYDADMRRSAFSEGPLFTQELKDPDILLVADERHDFARYLAYNTWTPVPMAGSEGLRAEAWAPAVEQWGAAQLQSRFAKASGRGMRPEDWAAWAAIRSLGEAVTRTGSADAAVLRTYLLSEDFELGGFKGRPLSFRDWNGQLRQPIPLATERAMVAMAPLEGFLHQVNELDTLGADRAESACRAFGG